MSACFGQGVAKVDRTLMMKDKKSDDDVLLVDATDFCSDITEDRG